MKLLRNRKIAILITAVVVVVAVLIGVNKSLTRLSRDIEGMFYDGVYLESGGYTQPGIDAALLKHADATLGLTTVLTNYPNLRDGAEEAARLRRELLDAASISEKGIAFRAMSRDVDNLIKAASEVELSERDLTALSQYSSTVFGAETFVKEAAYNERASELWSERSVFTRIIGMVLPARVPEMF